VNNNVELPCSQELESFFKNPPRKGTLLKLLWVNGEAVGFFIVRLEGIQEDSLVPVIMEMNILDAVFIRQTHRRRGWGSAMLKDIIKHFPDENIGFSHPISLSLQHVLKKFLLAESKYRSKFWNVKNRGEEGDRLNLWILLASRKVIASNHLL